MTRRALVFGGTGMLGHRVVPALAGSHEVHATVRDLDFAAPHVRATLHQLDVRDVRVLDDVVRRVAPEVVVNCAGIVKQLDAAKQAIPSISVNALFPHELAEVCARHDTWLIHVSTDCVFSGELPYPLAYREDDVPDARDLYGRTKLLGEVGAPALTLRTSIIGPELRAGNGLLEWYKRQAHRDVPGYRNAWFSGLTTDALADVIVRLVQAHAGMSGVFHVSSDPISKYDLLVRLRDVLSLGCTVRGVDEPSINRVLDCTRFQDSTKIRIPSWEQMLTNYAKESHDETA